MTHQILRLREGNKFPSFEELDVFISQYQLQEGHQYSVHKSKTIKAANVQKKIEERLVYYSLHYTCQRSGTYKSKGKGLRKTKSIKTNCPAFIKMKVSRNGDYLELDKFDENHNHPPLDVLTQGQSEPVYNNNECVDEKNEKAGELKSSSDNVLQVEVPELEPCEGCESPDASLDIAGLSIYIAQEANGDEKSSRVNLNDNLNVTLPILPIAGIPSDLKLVKVRLLNDGADSHCVPSGKFEKTSEHSNLRQESEQTSSKISEEPHFEDDLAAILDASELFADDQGDFPSDVFGNKEHINLNDNLNVTLPIAGIRSDSKLVKVRLLNDGADSHCVPPGKFEKTSEHSNFRQESEQTSSKISEEPHFEDDLAAILDASELFADDQRDFPSDVFGNKEQAKLKSESELDRESTSTSAIPKSTITACHEAVIYSMGTVQASSIVTVDNTNNTLDIDMPPIQRSRGRPKGAVLTAIGLPKRRNRAIDFNDRTPAAKARTILGWLIPDRILNNVLLGEYKITKHDIEHLTPETLTDAIVDILVDLSIVEEYFDKRGFSLLSKNVAKKQTLNKFKCAICNELVTGDCVLCSSCLLWHHYACVKLKRAPKTESWFCTDCVNPR